MSTYYMPGAEPKAPGNIFFFYPRHGPLSWGEPIPGHPALHKEKRTLPGAPASFSGIGCITALPGTLSSTLHHNPTASPLIYGVGKLQETE